jgi:hypothetical protein
MRRLVASAASAEEAAAAEAGAAENDEWDPFESV